jgi:hypothetical protein
MAWHHRQTQQLRVAELGWPSGQRPHTDGIVVDLYVECDHEGVHVCLHKPILDTLFACPQTLADSMIN